MQLNSMWFLLIVWSLVAYRLARFILLDSMIDGWRRSFYNWTLSPLGQYDRNLVLDQHIDEPLAELAFWRRKTYQLFSCPYCFTAYTSAGVLVAHRWFVDDFPVPVWMWLATWSGSLVIYTIIDSE